MEEITLEEMLRARDIARQKIRDERNSISRLREEIQRRKQQPKQSKTVKEDVVTIDITEMCKKG